ncbi:MAG TPA: TIM barrel protein [Chloroflexota bacterium]|nr:TIM barrel protein [Chloroflexota bacterium]
MKLCLKAKYVSEDPAVRLRYCRQLEFGATQESAKSLPAAVARGWPTADEVRALKAPFADAGIEVVALEPVKEPQRAWVEDTAAGRASFDAFARHLDAAGAAGIPSVTLHPPLDGARDAAEAAAHLEQNVAFYARAARRARDAGTRLATHSPYASPFRADGRRHLTKPLWGEQAFGELFAAVPAPENGLIYCFGCMHMADGDGLHQMARFIDRTFFVHVRDVVEYPDGSFDEVFPGQGTVDPEAAIRALWALGYRGPITPEHNPVVHGESYSGPVATAYSAGWCNAILKGLAAAEAAPAGGAALPLAAG